ncbi:hypothetical protein HOK51_04230 [Candidatus Woesearchaeota archaeon]|jgi:hypothetical protein|nr:hypothetical protein [Candidatus Woesearchaeota archaeon]MBT6519030.1 hypothetical protein [Candidatus Woesearchaeota archaeon]MBT7368771.1 hypothetical protein [Candidatus Woesearchaeota archaeon]
MQPITKDILKTTASILVIGGLFLGGAYVNYHYISGEAQADEESQRLKEEKRKFKKEKTKRMKKKEKEKESSDLKDHLKQKEKINKTEKEKLIDPCAKQASSPLETPSKECLEKLASNQNQAVPDDKDPYKYNPNKQPSDDKDPNKYNPNKQTNPNPTSPSNYDPKLAEEKETKRNFKFDEEKLTTIEATIWDVQHDATRYQGFLCNRDCTEVKGEVNYSYVFIRTEAGEALLIRPKKGPVKKGIADIQYAPTNKGKLCTTDIVQYRIGSGSNGNPGPTSKDSACFDCAGLITKIDYNL